MFHWFIDLEILFIDMFFFIIKPEKNKCSLRTIFRGLLQLNVTIRYMSFILVLLSLGLFWCLIQVFHCLNAGLLRKISNFTMNLCLYFCWIIITLKVNFNSLVSHIRKQVFLCSRDSGELPLIISFKVASMLNVGIRNKCFN